ncbi:hypothetical protein ACWF82_04920 [Nocardia sp. NPDC055053]
MLVIMAGAIGAIGFGMVSYARMTDQVDHFERISVPGAGSVHVVAGREYSAYIEYPVGTDAPEVSVELTDPAGHPVELRSVTRMVFQIGDHHGQARYAFHADDSGSYRVTVQGSPGKTVAVGSDIVPSIKRTVLGSLTIAAAGTLIGIAIPVTARRRGSRQES